MTEQYHFEEVLHKKVVLVPGSSYSTSSSCALAINNSHFPTSMSQGFILMSSIPQHMENGIGTNALGSAYIALSARYPRGESGYSTIGLGYARRLVCLPSLLSLTNRHYVSLQFLRTSILV